VARGGKRGTGKRGTLKVWKRYTIFKSKSYGAEIKTVYGSMDTPTDSDGDDSADDSDASTNAVVATVTTPATDSNEVERQGRGCSFLPHRHSDAPASFFTFTLRCVL